MWLTHVLCSTLQSIVIKHEVKRLNKKESNRAESRLRSARQGLGPPAFVSWIWCFHLKQTVRCKLLFIFYFLDRGLMGATNLWMLHISPQLGWTKCSCRGPANRTTVFSVWCASIHVLAVQRRHIFTNQKMIPLVSVLDSITGACWGATSLARLTRKVKTKTTTIVLIRAKLHSLSFAALKRIMFINFTARGRGCLVSFGCLYGSTSAVSHQ